VDRPADPSAHKYVYVFGRGHADGSAGQKALLGGKGANLAEMTNLGVPVPPGFTITTDVCRQHLMSHAMPEGVEDEIVRGLYRFRGASSDGHRVKLLGSGPIMREVLRAQVLLADHGVAADVWSAPSYHELRRDALACERAVRLTGSGPEPYVTRRLAEAEGPVIAASDSMKAVPDLIARWVPASFTSLGTDGFGRSDTREALRRRFEVDAEHIAVAALAALERAGTLPRAAVDRAIAAYGISPQAGL